MHLTRVIMLCVLLQTGDVLKAWPEAARLDGHETNGTFVFTFLSRLYNREPTCRLVRTTVCHFPLSASLLFTASVHACFWSPHLIMVIYKYMASQQPRSVCHHW